MTTALPQVIHSLPLFWQDNPPGPRGSSGSADGGQYCIENIGPRERARRAYFGALALVASLVLAAVLVLSGASRWWRLALFLPFAASASGFLQARART